MKKVAFVLMALCLVVLNQKCFAIDNKIVLGTWKVAVVDAPYQYAKSSFCFSEANGVLSGKVIFEDGKELKVSNLEFTKDVITFAVNIDGNDIKVKGKLENAKITGKVDSPNGLLDLTATKKQ